MEMTDGELLAYMGTSAHLWAEQFEERRREDPEKMMAESTMLTWFANAIQAGYNEARFKYEVRSGTEQNVFGEQTLDWSQTLEKEHGRGL